MKVNEIMKEGDMLVDLIGLLDALALSTKHRKEAKKPLIKKIVERHALPWYEGPISGPGVDTDRLHKFISKVKKIIPKALKLRKDPHRLGPYWIDTICDIDDGYKPSETNLEKLLTRDVMEDLMRIWMHTGGSSGHRGQQGYAYQKVLMERMFEVQMDHRRDAERFEADASARIIANRKKQH